MLHLLENAAPDLSIESMKTDEEDACFGSRKGAPVPRGTAFNRGEAMRGFHTASAFITLLAPLKRRASFRKRAAFQKIEFS